MLKKLATIAVMLFMSLVSHGDTTEVKDLLLMEAHAYRLTSDVSILALQEGAKRYHQRLDNTINSGDQLAVRLQPRWPAVSGQWQKSTEFVNAQREIAATNSDVNFTNDLDAVQKQLYTKIDAAKAELAIEEISGADYAANSALIALEKMVAGYMFFNINVFGGLAVTDLQMKQNAELFRDAIARMEGQDALKKQIQGKWTFIEKTLLNYNQQSATFIVMKTTDNIRELLSV